MTRMTMFNSPLFLGFDRFERMLDRVAKTGGDGYPPYNIEQADENTLRIVVAVAGFTRGELEIAVEDNQLTIRGRQQDDPKRVYLHRGIAARQFQRTFVLAEGIEIGEARLESGLLSIDLARPTPVPSARKIEIKGGETAGRKSETVGVSSVSR